MGKTVRFKNPDSVLNVQGRKIAPHNLTLEVYEELVRLAPSHADLFIVEEEEAAKSPKPPKPEKE